MPRPEIDAFEPGSAARRGLHVVRRVLEGEETDRVLGYALDGRHLAGIAVGRRPLESLRVLAWGLSGELLSVAVSYDTAWGWIRISDIDDAGVRRRLYAGALPPAAISTGSVAAGPQGFRESHFEARAAARVARLSGAALTVYEDVALEALTIADTEAARRFVRHVLGELGEERRRGRQLRTTLRAYLAAGQNAASAAAALGVHERTVSNRIRAAEAELRGPVARTHAELELALRLHELLT